MKIAYQIVSKRGGAQRAGNFLARISSSFINPVGERSKLCREREKVTELYLYSLCSLTGQDSPDLGNLRHCGTPGVAEGISGTD